jgi:hypothetical protein
VFSQIATRPLLARNIERPLRLLRFARLQQFDVPDRSHFNKHLPAYLAHLFPFLSGRDVVQDSNELSYHLRGDQVIFSWAVEPLSSA